MRFYLKLELKIVKNEFGKSCIIMGSTNEVHNIFCLKIFSLWHNNTKC